MMTKDIINHAPIRQATPDDAAQISGVISEALVLYCKNSRIEKTQLAAGLETEDEIREMTKSSLFYVFEKDEKIIGTIRLTFPNFKGLSESESSADIFEDKNVCYISRFYVHSDYHGHGIGRELLTFAEEKARSEAISSMFLHTAIENKKLVGFYQKRGFTLFEKSNRSSYPRGLFVKKITKN